MKDEGLREKVLKALKCCAGTGNGKTCLYISTANDCPYEDLCGEYEDAFYECTKALAADALELLEEQEPVEPITDHGVVSVTYRCGNCKTHFYMNKQKYCAICGRAVKWDDGQVSQSRR